jgi:hypothetical protein
MCNCQKTPVTVPITPGFQGNVGEGSTVTDNDVTETRVITKNVQNSTWLILGQDIIRTVKFLVMFIVIAFAVYRLIARGKFPWLGEGR